MTKPTLTPASNAHTSSRFHMERFDLPMQDRICNASSKLPLVRPGSEDFLRLKSRGV